MPCSALSVRLEPVPAPWPEPESGRHGGRGYGRQGSSCCRNVGRELVARTRRRSWRSGRSHSLCRRRRAARFAVPAAGQIVFEGDGYFLGHLSLPDVNGACAVSWPMSSAHEQRRRSGMGPGSSITPAGKHFRRRALVVPLRSVNHAVHAGAQRAAAMRASRGGWLAVEGAPDGTFCTRGPCGAGRRRPASGSAGSGHRPIRKPDVRSWPGRGRARGDGDLGCPAAARG
jgi:hypothetical protein